MQLLQGIFTLIWSNAQFWNSYIYIHKYVYIYIMNTETNTVSTNFKQIEFLETLEISWPCEETLWTCMKIYQNMAINEIYATQLHTLSFHRLKISLCHPTVKATNTGNTKLGLTLLWHYNCTIQHPWCYHALHHYKKMFKGLNAKLKIIVLTSDDNFDPQMLCMSCTLRY